MRATHSGLDVGRVRSDGCSIEAGGARPSAGTIPGAGGAHPCPAKPAGAGAGALGPGALGVGTGEDTPAEPAGVGTIVAGGPGKLGGVWGGAAGNDREA